MKVARQLLHITYLKRYLALRPGSMEEIERWRGLQRIAGPASASGTENKRNSPSIKA